MAVSPVSIIRCSNKLVKQQILPRVPRVWLRQVRFGVAVLSLRSVVSCNANARMSGLPRGTAESKMSRLLANAKLPAALASVVADLGLVTRHSFVNVDHSDFSGLVALVFAVQTRIGRALPIFVETSYSGKLSACSDVPKRTKKLRAYFDALTTNETQRTIASLKTLRKVLGFWPKLVFDRGFGSAEIIRYLHSQQTPFFIRLKAGRIVEIAGKQLSISDSRKADEQVIITGLKLRVIRSPKTGKNEEPWYILTNDLASSRNKIVRIYYHRFEIEETFRDIKTILGLRRTKMNKPNSLAILLWFVVLGILILYLAGIEVLGIQQLRTRLKNQKAKKRLSWYRILLELRETEITRLQYEILDTG